MLPREAYGLIQCKQRYSTQAEMQAVAKGIGIGICWCWTGFIRPEWARRTSSLRPGLTRRR